MGQLSHVFLKQYVLIYDGITDFEVGSEIICTKIKSRVVAILGLETYIHG